jgi:hypothetical protein
MTIIDKLLISNRQLETDLIKLRSHFENCKNGHLLWVATFRDLRSDDIVGLIDCYHNNKPIQHYFSFRESVAPLKIVIPFLKGLFSKKVFSDKKSIWILTGKHENKHRYRNLLSYFSSLYSFYCFTNNFSEDVVTENFNSLNFARQARITDIFIALKISISLSIYASKIKDTSLVAQWIKNTPWTFYFNMALKDIWIDRALSKCPPGGIFFSTANTYPPARLLSRKAKLHNVPFIVIACRTMFVTTRPEERACILDIEEVNDAKIADYWLVWDKYSKNTLTQFNIESNKIFVSQPKAKNEKRANSNNGSYLLLLTHDKAQNENFINLWCDILEKVNIAFSIRKHPLCDLTTQQKEKLDKFQYTDYTGIPFSQLDMGGMIGISINSTAAIDICAMGGGVIWLPFLNPNSIVFEPIFDIIGLKVSDVKDFERALNEFENQDVRDSFVKASTDAYEKHFSSKDETLEFVNTLNTILK